MATHYNGSRGPVEIATMPYPHLLNAHDKLKRSRTDDTRDAEIAAMASRLAEMDMEYGKEGETL